jgi:rare lipoprotein A
MFAAMPCAAPPHDPRWSGTAVGIACALLLAACASAPPPRGPRPAPADAPTAPPPAAVPAAGPAAPIDPDRNGPDARPPPDLERVPDAEPKLEPIRPGGPNKPYEVAGQAYVPITQDGTYTERGLASWYGRPFHGRRTASGEVYNMYAMTAAHKTLPIPSYARVRNPASGAEILVRVNDRGPFVKGRIVDLSYTAALKLGVLRNPTAVEVERITFDAIRTGAWRRGAPTVATAIAEPVVLVVPMAEASASPSAPAPPPPPPIATAPAAAAYTAPARGFWVQLGAFRERGGAEDFHRRVMAEHDWLTPLLAVFIDLPLFRLQAGPYPSRDEARGAAEQIRSALRLVPVIVERR